MPAIVCMGNCGALLADSPWTCTPVWACSTSSGVQEESQGIAVQTALVERGFHMHIDYEEQA